MATSLSLNGVGVIGSSLDQPQHLSQSSSPSVPLPPDSHSGTMNMIGAVRRKVRMGSRFQNGTLQTRGNWVYLLYRVDTPTGRKQVTERICPASGQGSLSAAQQRRKAQEIITESGVNKEQKIIEATLQTTFSQQAEWYMKNAQQRKKKPAAPSTLTTWQSAIDKWLNPLVGHMPLAQLNNGAAKRLVEQLVDGGLSPKSVGNYLQLFKAVVGSAVNDEGDQLIPRTWNSEHIDAPEIDEQRKPVFTSEDINRMLETTDDDQLQVLIVLLAASGMRVGEALGLDISNVSEDGTMVTVTEKAYHGEVQSFLKTKNGKRVVDLAPEVGTLLREYIGKRKGLVFQTSKGHPLSQSNILRRQLHPLLKTLGLTECGFHAFRRFRTTWLRMQRAPEKLTQFWLGHADKTITDSYDRSPENAVYRKDEAVLRGIGFTVPVAVVSKVSKVEKGEEVATLEPVMV